MVGRLKKGQFYTGLGLSGRNTPRFSNAKDLNASPGPEGTQEIIAMHFLNATAFDHASCNLSWGFPLGNLLPKTRVFERKRKTNANTSLLGMLRFRTLRSWPELKDLILYQFSGVQALPKQATN